jgi:hypothetical protein
MHASRFDQMVMTVAAQRPSRRAAVIRLLSAAATATLFSGLDRNQHNIALAQGETWKVCCVLSNQGEITGRMCADSGRTKVFALTRSEIEATCPTGWAGITASDCSGCAALPTAEAQPATEQRDRRCCFLRSDEGADVIARVCKIGDACEAGWESFDVIDCSMCPPFPICF